MDISSLVREGIAVWSANHHSLPCYLHHSESGGGVVESKLLDTSPVVFQSVS